VRIAARAAEACLSGACRLALDGRPDRPSAACTFAVHDAHRASLEVHASLGTALRPPDVQPCGLQRTVISARSRMPVRCDQVGASTSACASTWALYRLPTLAGPIREPTRRVGCALTPMPTKWRQVILEPLDW
jgi:hypothetical protein